MASTPPASHAETRKRKIKVRWRTDTKESRLQVDFWARPPAAPEYQRYRYAAPDSITSEAEAETWARELRDEIEAGRLHRQARRGRQEPEEVELTEREIELGRRVSSRATAGRAPRDTSKMALLARAFSALATAEKALDELDELDLVNLVPIEDARMSLEELGKQLLLEQGFNVPAVTDNDEFSVDINHPTAEGQPPSVVFLVPLAKVPDRLVDFLYEVAQKAYEKGREATATGARPRVRHRPR